MAPEGAEEQAEMAEAKAGLYGLLARVFSARPTPELVRGMKERQMLEALSVFEVSFEDDFLAGDESKVAEELAVEHTRLFVGPGPHIAAYESVYVRGEGEDEPRLWGKATVEVAESYLELGLELPVGRTPDQLGFELEVMSAMAQGQAEMLGTGDEEGAQRLAVMQERFCQEHLIRWVPAVCRDVERRTTSSFYRSMASLAAGLVEMTCDEGERID